MKPGQAKLEKRGGNLSLIVCDEPGNVPLGAVEFAGHGLLHQVTMTNGVIVPVIELVLRLIAGDAERTYRGFVNELEDSIMESLATTPEITVVLTYPTGARFGTSPLANPFRATANESLGIISELQVAVAYVLNKDN